MKTLVMHVVLCMSTDPAVNDCERVFVAPVQVESAVECYGRLGQILKYFRGIETHPHIFGSCRRVDGRFVPPNEHLEPSDDDPSDIPGDDT